MKPYSQEATTPISPKERQRRQAAVQFARGNVRLEGFVLSPEAEAINQQYIAGELTSAQHLEAIQALAAASGVTP